MQCKLANREHPTFELNIEPVLLGVYGFEGLFALLRWTTMLKNSFDDIGDFVVFRILAHSLQSLWSFGASKQRSVRV